ncbi:hypothetical protein MPH47_14040 [Psychrobacillus psychrodurans]|uniref:hypothetical protein n=1 Tax=Psychrobacillus psychrodurans TaxID=126157 RepID=UPI001F4D73FA|nr:hypothetical protein [Psychrobacillus psychrodurans]MCK1998321.1 hypothetical protein [Psychrobacillus psychrodurans]
MTKQSIKITTIKHNYEQRELTTAATGYATAIENNYGTKLGFGFRKPYLEVLDVALAKQLDSLAIAYDTADVTIDTGSYVLSAAQQTAIKDKYELESQFETITFA